MNEARMTAQRAAALPEQPFSDGEKITIYLAPYCLAPTSLACSGNGAPERIGWEPRVAADVNPDERHSYRRA